MFHIVNNRLEVGVIWIHYSEIRDSPLICDIIKWVSIRIKLVASFILSINFLLEANGLSVDSGFGRAIDNPDFVERPSHVLVENIFNWRISQCFFFAMTLLHVFPKRIGCLEDH